MNVFRTKAEPGRPLTKQERLARKNAFDGSLVMGVRKFNQATGRQRHRDEALSELVDQNTGLLKADLARDRSCPICGGRFGEPLFVKGGFPHGRCPDCKLIYVNPVLKDEAVLAHYQGESSWVEVLESGPQVEMDRLKYAYGLEAARPYFEGADVLDVGAGTGWFVRTAREMGFNPTALELHKKNAARLKGEGFPVIEVPLEESGLDSDSFDLVTLWEVLEHIVDPGPLLSEIKRVLRPAGLLLILVPNADSLVTRLLHEKSGTFGGHSHVNFFNAATLERLLAKAGFEVLETETLITELGTINNYLNFEDPYLGRAEAGLDFLSPQLIHDHLLGSKLMVLARPVKEKEQNR